MNICQGKNCKNPVKYEILYDCGVQSEELNICEKHYKSDGVFRQNIKTIIEVDTK